MTGYECMLPWTLARAWPLLVECMHKVTLHPWTYSLAESSTQTCSQEYNDACHKCASMKNRSAGRRLGK